MGALYILRRLVSIRQCCGRPRKCLEEAVLLGGKGPAVDSTPTCTSTLTGVNVRSRMGGLTSPDFITHSLSDITFDKTRISVTDYTQKDVEGRG